MKSVYAETSPVQREEFRKWLDHHNNGCYIVAQVSDRVRVWGRLK